MGIVLRTVSAHGGRIAVDDVGAKLMTRDEVAHVAVSIGTRSIFASLAVAYLWLLGARAHAGPPFRTDDPVPVALGHYELYTAAIGTHVKGDTSGALPGVELTYGLIPNGQLQVGGEAAFDSPVLFSAGRGLQNEIGRAHV